MQDPDGTAPDCVDDTDPDKRLVTASTDRFATDRVTALAVNDGCTSARPPSRTTGSSTSSRSTCEQKTYPFWDGLVGRAVDASSRARRTSTGSPPTSSVVSLVDEPAEISNGVSGLYSTEKTMWIDQGTGSIIDQSEAQTRKLDDGTTVLDLELSFTDDTIAANVEDAKANNSQLALVARAPIVLGILGLLALAGGLFLALAGRRARPRHPRARAARAAPSTRTTTG